MSRRHPLILAIDDAEPRIQDLVQEACKTIAGVKIGLPVLVSEGVAKLRTLRRLCDDMLWVLDLKLADIAAIMVKTVEKTVEYVDAVIAHSFIGVKGALQTLREELDKNGVRLILVATMSHPGATEVYDRSLPLLLRVIDEVDPWGLVAPATRPILIRWLREQYPRKSILSPGVGVQGAKPGTAICSGADYEIVGRTITSAQDPISALHSIISLQKEAIERCKKTAY